MLGSAATILALRGTKGIAAHSSGLRHLRHARLARHATHRALAKSWSDAHGFNLTAALARFRPEHLSPA